VICDINAIYVLTRPHQAMHSATSNSCESARDCGPAEACGGPAILRIRLMTKRQEQDSEVLWRRNDAGKRSQLCEAPIRLLETTDLPRSSSRPSSFTSKVSCIRLLETHRACWDYIGRKTCTCTTTSRAANAVNKTAGLEPLEVSSFTLDLST
jgi:hypothetical protein